MFCHARGPLHSFLAAGRACSMHRPRPPKFRGTTNWHGTTHSCVSIPGKQCLMQAAMQARVRGGPGGIASAVRGSDSPEQAPQREAGPSRAVIERMAAAPHREADPHSLAGGPAAVRRRARAGRRAAAARARRVPGAPQRRAAGELYGGDPPSGKSMAAASSASAAVSTRSRRSPSPAPRRSALRHGRSLRTAA